MALKSQDIKNGSVIRVDGKLQIVVEFLHVKPGKGNTFMRTKLKDLVTGYVVEKRFNIGEVLEDVRVERRPYQFLYMDGEDAVFMNQETFDQVNIDKKMITGGDYMKEGDIVDVLSDTSTDTILTAEMPDKTVLEITYCEPGIAGNTATNASKIATLENGSSIRVPLFINQGDKVVVKTADGSYVERAK